MNIELRNIHKWFGSVHANIGINMTISSGTIQGIVGENGAGKSTLMKVLSGYIQAEEGEIILDGKSIKIKTPADAIHYGIGMLHQDPLDFPPMKVIDNFLLGNSGGIFPNRKTVGAQFSELAKQFDFSINPDDYVDSLTVGERQQLEILRLLWLGARVLILDEPTTGISAQQKDKLFDTLKKLTDKGISIIFVSHKLEEIESLCQRVSVLRAGKLVGEAVQPYNTDDLVRLMFEKEMKLGERKCFGNNEAVLKVVELEIEDYRLHIKGVNLEINKGEVIGLAGMEGSGQRLFLNVLGGLIRPVGHSKVTINNQNLTHKAYINYMREGVSYVPADRMEEGLIPGLTLTEHFILAEDNKGIMINHEKAIAVTNERIRDFNIRGKPESHVEELSGGNQQRALLALLRTHLSLVLVEHPTRGLDIESAMYIWGKLKERCEAGTSIIFTSSDLEEILQYSDRILVFFGGKVSNPLNAKDTTVDQLGQLIGGKGF